ncbi:MAG: hypothetical protein LBK26_01065 [Rickettsiales bacterium]|jgi:phosphotransacetylase|nr:hypothetical protein [Rickettsiales bacterium]
MTNDKKTLLVIGSQKNYIKLWRIRRMGIKRVMDVSVEEFRNMIEEGLDSAKLIIMKGIVETSDFLRTIIKLNKKLGGSWLTQCSVVNPVPRYFWQKAKKPYILTDPAVVPYPDFEQYKIMTRNAILLARQLNLSDKPVVNFLTPSSKIDPNIEFTLTVKELEEWMAKEFPELVVTHNAWDVCFSEHARKVKKIDAPRPDIVVCEIMNQANSIYKALSVDAGYNIAGLLAGNPKMPVVSLNSRGDSIKDKLWAIRLGCRFK